MKKILFSFGFLLIFFANITPTFADFSSPEEENIFLQITNLLPPEYKESFLGEYELLQANASSGLISERKAQKDWKILRTKVIGIYRVILVRKAQQNTEMAIMWAGTYESYTDELEKISSFLNEAESNFFQEYFGSAEKKLNTAKNKLQEINITVKIIK